MQPLRTMCVCEPVLWSLRSQTITIIAQTRYMTRYTILFKASVIRSHTLTMMHYYLGKYFLITSKALIYPQPGVLVRVHHALLYIPDV